MPTPNRLRDLATLIENIDAGTTTVTDVQTPSQRLIDDQTLTVQLVAQLQWESLGDLDGRISISIPEDTPITTGEEDDELEIPLEVMIDAPEQTATAEQSTDATESEVTDGGVDVRGSADPTETTSSVTDPVADHPHQQEGEGNDVTADSSVKQSGTSVGSSPPHRDPKRLRDVYDACETFPEMTEALGADVTPQTVRHHMIKHGIHQPDAQKKSATTETEDPTSDESTPTSPDQQSDAGEGQSHSAETVDESKAPESGASLADDAGTDASPDVSEASRGGDQQTQVTVTEDDLPSDIDLPSHLTLDAVTQAVAESQTLYEVQRELRMDRSKARQLLRDLDLLSFVSGRVAAAEDQQTPEDEITEHIRQVCT